MDQSQTATPVSVLGTVYGVVVALAAGVLLPDVRLDGSVVPQVGFAGLLLVLVVGVPQATAFLAGPPAAAVAYPLVMLLVAGMLLTSPRPLPTIWSFLLAAVVLQTVRTVVTVVGGRRPVLLIRRDARRLLRAGLEGAGAVLGLVLAMGLGLVVLAPAAPGHRLLAVVVFASLFAAIPLPPPAWSPRDTGGARGFWRVVAVGVGVRLGSAAVKLGAVWWAAGFTAVPVSFDGVGAFAAAASMSALVLPVRSAHGHGGS